MTYHIEHVTSALDFLRALPDRSVDHVISDPPYNESARNARSVWKGKPSPGSLMGYTKDGLGGTKIGGIKWHLSDQDIRDLAAEVLRVTRRWSILFCAIEQIGAYRSAAQEAWIRTGVWIPDHDADDAANDLDSAGPLFVGGLWDRFNTGTPQLTGDRPAMAAEGLAIMHGPPAIAGKKRWHGRGKRGVWRHAVCRPQTKEPMDRRIHPAQKPLALMRDLVRDFTDPGEVILDPFCGSGTTGLACILEGRSFIGCDRDEQWIDRAKARLDLREDW